MTRGQGYQTCGMGGGVFQIMGRWRKEYRVVSVPDQRQVELIRNLVTLKVSKYVVSCPAGIFNINLMV